METQRTPLLRRRKPQETEWLATSSDWLLPGPCGCGGGCIWSVTQDGQTGHDSTCFKLVAFLNITDLFIPHTLSLTLLKFNQVGAVFRTPNSLKKTRPSASSNQRAFAKFEVSLAPGASKASGQESFESLEKLLHMMEKNFISEDC